jgi:monoamine oxidase
MNRRDFGKLLLGSGLVAGGVRFGVARPAPKKIVIVGAGLSGLIAAYELRKLGNEILVLEAQPRVGGRVLTLRDFAGGQYADAGAARIPVDHDLTRRYIKEFDLGLLPFYPTTGKFVRIRDGRAEPTDWNGFTEATGSVMSLGKANNWQKIKGGNDLLPMAFAERLSGLIRFNSPVSRIEQKDGRSTVTFIDAGKQVTAMADIVICAVPFTMLGKIEFAPRLSEAKQKIITSETYDSASRIFVQTKERFWEKGGLNGFGFGSRSDEIWDASFGEAGSHGILESYSRSDYSRELTGQADSARVETVISSFEKIFPGVRTNQVRTAGKCWSEDPWVRGAWAHLGFDEVVTMLKPEGQVYFAGEHLSFSPSWMQGALQSGLGVVDKVSKLPA